MLWCWLGLRVIIYWLVLLVWEREDGVLREKKGEKGVVVVVVVCFFCYFSFEFYYFCFSFSDYIVNIDIC